MNSVPNGSVTYKSALVKVVAWLQTGDKPSPEQMTHFTDVHVCPRPQCVNHSFANDQELSVI